MHKELREFDKAGFHYRRAKELRPTDPDLAFQLGIFYRLQGLHRAAELAFEEALRLKPGWTAPALELEALRNHWVRDAAVRERDAAVAERDAAIRERDAAVAGRNAALRERAVRSIIGKPRVAALEKIGPIAPEHLRARVNGTPDEQWWGDSGAMTVGEWMRLLACLNRDIGEFETIVDWGCGCGRALRYLPMKLKAGQHLIGMDVDAEAIAWVRANYPDLTLFAIAEAPPTPLDDHSVDLIVSFSIFTHLPEGIADAWLAELARILKPGGLLITTVHGEKHVKQHQKSMPPEFADIMDCYGFYYRQGRRQEEAPLPGYYGGTFHSIRYITRRWTKWFTVRAWIPSFALSSHDSLVLEKN
jgi:SAM-dependent methyltransferase